MALPSSGAISLSQVNVELGKASNDLISLNDADVRALFGVASGLISMSDGYGKSSEVRFINSTDRTSVSIFTLMGSPTEPGDYVFENQATISAGSGSYALRTGVFPAGSTLHIINNGYIRGKGGAGGAATYNSAAAGEAGGTAFYADFPCTIDNSGGYIFGGGGGGGGALGRWWNNTISQYMYGFAGGGGGQGSSGGAAGSGIGTYTKVNQSAGTASAGGSYGRGAAISTGAYYAQSGAGGAAGAAAGAGSTSASYASRLLASAGAAGAAIAKNGKVVTITAGNDTTRIKGAVA